MATKRPLPPLVGGIQPASVVDDDDIEAEEVDTDEEDEDEDEEPQALSE